MSVDDLTTLINGSKLKNENGEVGKSIEHSLIRILNEDGFELSDIGTFGGPNHIIYVVEIMNPPFV